MKEKRVLVSGVFVLAAVVGLLFFAGCASTANEKVSEVKVPDGAQTISTADGRSVKQILQLYYTTYHYEATKPIDTMAGLTYGMVVDKSESKFKFATINAQQFTKKQKESKISRLITDDSVTIVYQSKKGAITEVYSNIESEGCFYLTPDSNLSMFRKHRQQVLKPIRD